MDQRRTDAFVDLLLGKSAPVPVDLQVIVPADTLTGASDDPGWVPGLGPITAQQARALVSDPAVPVNDLGDGVISGVVNTVRALITEPATGALRDVAETRYRPTLALQRAVRARDVTCRFPGCRRAASGNHSGTDLDHVVPWPAGPTSAAHLAVLCRRHHRLKHSARWSVVLLGDGTMVWTTPTGRSCRSYPWQYTEPAPASLTACDDPDPPPPE